MPNVPERELAHFAALAACARALLAGDAGPSLREALEAVLHASGASSVTNAVRYGGPTVSVHTGVKGDVVAVSVADDGPPIPEDAHDRIFEAYERAHRPATQPASVGLGLTVSRTPARLIRGTARRGGRRDAGRAGSLQRT